MKTMKKCILILSLLFNSLSALYAQDGDDQAKQDKIRPLYVAYVTKQLNLTPDEAQKFWPVHTQFENDIKGVNKDLPELQKQQAYLDVKKKYQDNFNRIIGPGRCDRFFRMDGEFKRKLLEIRNQRQQNQQRPRVRRLQ
jgi:hypothetical protein